MDFPDDENGSVLQSMQDAGMDLTREYNFEFWHLFQHETSAQEMERRVKALGYQVEIFDNSQIDESDLFDDEEGDETEGDFEGESAEGEDGDDEEGLDEGFDLLCIVPMVPSHAAITAMEQKLSQIAESCGGEADGWGVMDTESEPSDE